MKSTPKSKIVARTWIERVDGACHVACAHFEEVYRGDIFSASSILLFEPVGRWAVKDAQDQAVEKLKAELVRGDHVRHQSGLNYYIHQRNRMPFAGKVRDLRR